MDSVRAAALWVSLAAFASLVSVIAAIVTYRRVLRGTDQDTAESNSQ